MENVLQMSNIETLIKNAVDNAEITDYIVLVRGKCFTLILVEDFIKDITLGGDAVCETLLNCWKSMGQFDGGINPENGDDDPCNCNDDFVKLHFPKGEGIKIIDDEGKAIVPDTIYPVRLGEDKFDLIIIDEDGSKRRINVGEGGVTTFLSNIGSGANLLVKNSDSDYNVKSIKSSDSSLTIDGNANELDIKANFPVVDGKSSSDYGVPIYDGLDSDKKIKMLPVSSGQINIKKKTTPQGQDYLDFDIPESVDDTIKSFYVNENYTGSGTGNGSILKPYKKLTYALKDIIGTTGSAISPRYRNSVVNLLSDVTVTQADLDNVPELKNRLTVNTTTIKSDNNYTINFDVENGVDYPFSTTFLKDEAVAGNKPGWYSFTLYNIIVYSEKVKGLFKGETFVLSGISGGAILNNVSFNNNYNASVFQPLYYTSSDSTSALTYSATSYPVMLFGVQAKGQVGQITNTTPVVYISGGNAGGQSNIIISNSLSIVSSSQTLLKIENTGFGIDGELSIGLQSYNISLKSLTTKKPVDGFYAIDIENAYLRVEKLTSTYETPEISGFDSIIRYYDNGSNASYSVLISSANLYRTLSNYLVKINSIARPNLVANINSASLGRSSFYETAFINDRNISEVIGVGVQGSEINNVKKSSITGVLLGATLAQINGSMFSSLPFAANQADAVTKSLLPSTFYVDGSGNIKMVQAY